jgi:hypothetical protein
MTPEMKIDIAKKWWQGTDGAEVRVTRDQCHAGHWIVTKAVGGSKDKQVDETPILFKRGDAR